MDAIFFFPIAHMDRQPINRYSNFKGINSLETIGSVAEYAYKLGILRYPREPPLLTYVISPVKLFAGILPPPALRHDRVA